MSSKKHRNPMKPSRPVPAAPAPSWFETERGRDLSLLFLLIAGVALYRFIVLAAQPGPPGSDGGNWLAFTRDFFGPTTKAAESMYFPGTLVLLKALLVFLPDLSAVKVLAVGSSVAAGIPFYFLARRACPPVFSAYLTVLLLMAGFLIEVMTWGGYPQLLGTAYLLGTVYMLDSYLHSGERRDLGWAAVGVGLVFVTHHFTVMILAATIALYLPVIAWRERHGFMLFARRTMTWGLLGGGLSLLTLPWYLRYLSLLSGEGTLGATKEQIGTFTDVLSYVFSEAPLTWIFLGSVIPLAAMLPIGGAGAARLRPMAAALTAGPLLVYFFTDEGRAMQPMQAGILLCLGIVGVGAIGFLKHAKIAPTIAVLGRATLAMAALGLLMILAPNGHIRQDNAIERYGALDAQAVEALSWLRDETPPGSVILPGDRSGWVSYAWWVEGYAHRPAYGLIDPRFLAFKEEQAQSAVALKIIDDDTPAAEAQALVRQAGITYFFIYKPSGGSFQSLVERVPVQMTFQNDAFIIFKVADENADATTLYSP